MQKSGYDKFFKQARKAAQSKPAQAATKGEMKFRIQPDSMSGGMSPEDQLRRELVRRMKDKKVKKLRDVRERQKFPLFAAFMMAAAVAACGFGYFHHDEVEEFLSKIEVRMMGQASAAAETPKANPPSSNQPAKTAASSGPEAEKAAAASAPAKEEKPLNVKQWSQEELSFFSKLNDRKRELDMREADLARLEEELQKRKSELDARLKALEAMRAEISQTLKSRVTADQEKVDKLVQFYSNMKPQQAAKVMESLNEDLAVEILDKMKKKSAADVLNMMNAKKAQRLSEMLTGYQRSVASAKESEDDRQQEPQSK